MYSGFPAVFGRIQQFSIQRTIQRTIHKLYSTQLDEDTGRNGRERRVDNATHLLEAWDCLGSHGALAQAQAIQVDTRYLQAARGRRLTTGGRGGAMLRHDRAAQGPTVERQKLARPTAIIIAVGRAMLY